MGGKFNCSGVPWLAEGQSATYTEANLTAKVLCSRHNSALSPLDTAAERLFNVLSEIRDRLHRKSWSKKLHLYAINGENLELWALKTLMGIYYAEIARFDGKGRRAGLELPLLRYCALLAGETRLSTPMGMYVQADVGHWFVIEDSISMSPLIDRQTGEIAALWLSYAGLSLRFLFHADMVDEAYLKEGNSYRPTDLNFVSEEPVDERLFLLKLGWPPPHIGSVTFSLMRSSPDGTGS